MIRLIILLFIVPMFTNAQRIDLIDKSVNPGEIIDELPLPPPGLKGSLYIADDWVNGDIWLKNNKVLRGYPIKFDLKNNLLEINADGNIKVCALPLLERFSYKAILGDSIDYYNTSVVNNVTFDLPKGVCRILLNDKVQLIQYEYIEIVKANYNVAIDMGSKDNKAIKKTKPYVIVNDNVYEVKGSIKKNFEIFKVHFKKVESFVKENKLKFKSDQDLTKIFEFYNTLL
jgi:hypothetical protein